METVLIASFLTQYDTVITSFKEMKPFININEETKYYRFIFVLKILFVVYAFDRTVQRPLSLVLKYAGCKNPVSREIFPNIVSASVIYLLYEKKVIVCLYEFLIDIFLVLFSLTYAVEAYKKELHKISAILFMGLFVQWFTNNTVNTEQFRLISYLQVSALLLLSYFPLMPSNSKYRLRFTYLYLLMYICIFYKLDQHYNKHQYAMHQNKKALEYRQTTVEPGRIYPMDTSMDTSDEKEVNKNSEHLTGTVRFNIEQYQLNEFSKSSKIKNEPKTDINLKLPETAYTSRKSGLDESEETHFEKADKSGWESAIAAPEEETDGSKAVKWNKVTEADKVADNYKISEALKSADGGHKTSESDANFKPEGKEISKPESLLFPLEWRIGEIKVAVSKEKSYGLDKEVGSSDLAIPKTKSVVVRENLQNIQMVEITPLRIGHDKTQLQMKEYGEDKSGSLIPKSTEKQGEIAVEVQII